MTDAVILRCNEKGARSSTPVVNSRKERGEEPRKIAQEGALAFNASELLK
jgi:hypothetical protein